MVRHGFAKGVTELSNDPAEEQAAHEFKPRTLDAWSWIARARAAAARTVEPVPPSADAVDTGAAQPADELHPPAD